MAPRIMVFEDDPSTLAMFKEVLGDEGYTVIAHPHPYVTLSDIIDAVPSLIIVDWVSARVSHARELFQELKAHDSGATIPIVLCTTDRRLPEENAERLRALGIATLVKPFALNTLVDCITSHLGAET